MGMIVVDVVDCGAGLRGARRGNFVKVCVNQAAVVVIVMIGGVNVLERRYGKSQQQCHTRLKSDDSTHH